MTKRYYYTDPLAAAWMAKHFGMNYSGWGGGIPSDAGYLGEIEIHPDSLHLLEPQVGDLCEKKDKRSGCGYCGMDRFYDADNETIDLYGKESIVIQRNGLAFHWPLTEES